MVQFSSAANRLAARLGTGLSRFRSGARILVLAAALIGVTSMPVHSRDAVKTDAFPSLAGLRFGISVTDLDGNILLQHRADERFMPASNAKLFVTAAALASEAELTTLDPALQLVLEPNESGAPNLVLVGRGDPGVGFGPDCQKRCLEALAEAVSDAGIVEVADIIGDDQWFADEPRPLGWSWDDLKFGHGTSISAIAVNENTVPLRVSSSGEVGANINAAWLHPEPAYFDLKNEAMTSAAESPSALRLERRLGNKTARLYGELPVGSRTLTLDLAVDNPAHLAAWAFKNALEAKGVSVLGEPQTRHRALRYADEPTSSDPNDPDAPLNCGVATTPLAEEHVIASLDPTPIEETVTKINRDSQNLYAEVLLRQLGRAAGTGSSFCGLLQIRTFMDQVGVPRASYEIADGSGLSNYNRATPASITALLRYAAAAPWGETYRASLPVGGTAPGTLRYRFRGTALEGKIFAKTGTLNHVDALSGYMQASSGEMLVFSILVNDRPLESRSAMPQIEETLIRIAEQF